MKTNNRKSNKTSSKEASVSENKPEKRHYGVVKQAHYDIPHKVYERITALDCSDLVKQRGFVATIAIMNSSERYDMSGWAYMSKSYWYDLIGSNYNTVLRVMKDNGIFLCNEKYHFGSSNTQYNFCKMYRIPDELADGPTVTVQVGKKVIDPLCEHVNASMQLLEIDQKKNRVLRKENMAKAMDTILDVSEHDPKDKTMPFRILGLPGNLRMPMRPYESAKSTAEKIGKRLFRRGRKRYASTKEEIEEMVSKEVSKQWELSEKKVNYKDAQIGTNGRMFHSIANSPKKLIESMTLRGQRIVQIDLKNSQMLIQAKWMNDTMRDAEHHLGGLANDSMKEESEEDRKEESKERGEERDLGGLLNNQTFCGLAASGLLYDELASRLGMTREEAKEEVLCANFSSPKYRNRTKDLMREMFPEEMALVDREKTVNGKASMANILQKMESDLFIKDIGHKLYLQGIYFIPKHDSILFAEGDRDAVYATITGSMDAYFGTGTYRLTEEVLTR